MKENIRLAKELVKVARQLLADSPSDIRNFENALERYAREISSDSFAERNTLHKYWDNAGGVYSLIKKFIKTQGAKDIEVDIHWHSGATFKCVVGDYNVTFEIDGKNRLNHGGWEGDKTIKVIGYDVRVGKFNYISSAIANLTKEEYIKKHSEKKLDFLKKAAGVIKGAINQYASRANEKDKLRVQNMLGESKSVRQVYSEFDRIQSNKAKLLPRLSLFLQSKDAEGFAKREPDFYFLIGDAFRGMVDPSDSFSEIKSFWIGEYFFDADRVERKITSQAEQAWDWYVAPLKIKH